MWVNNNAQNNTHLDQVEVDVPPLQVRHCQYRLHTHLRKLALVPAHAASWLGAWDGHTGLGKVRSQGTPWAGSCNWAYLTGLPGVRLKAWRLPPAAERQ